MFHPRPPPLPDEERRGVFNASARNRCRQPAIGNTRYPPTRATGSQCRHNLNYWQFGDYLGVGAGAHGKVSLNLPGEILRTPKPKQPRDFQQRIATAGAGSGNAISSRSPICRLNSC